MEIIKYSSAIVYSIYSHWAFSISAGILCYLLSSTIFNLYWSPLAKYPGPFFAKVSGIPSFYYALKGTRHIWIWQCHQIYGDAFRFQPNGIIINTPTGFRSIYGASANVKKGKFYEVFPRNQESRDTLSTTDPVIHSKRRRILNSVFSERAIRSAEPFIIRHTNRWCDLLHDDKSLDEWTRPKNISENIDFLVFDILGDLCFGRSFDSKEPGENRLKGVPHSISMYLKFMYPITKSPIINTWVWLKPHGLDKFLNLINSPAQTNFRKFVAESVNQRTNQEQKLEEERAHGEQPREDMFHYLFNAKDPDTGGSAYTPLTLKSEAFLLIVAGTHTTSVAISAFFFYITHNDKVYQKLTKEIRSKFRSLDEILGQKLMSCQYLRACVDEALRMAPPTPGELSREVLPGGIHIDGKFLPEGVNIGTSQWSLMHHDEVFGDPWVYRPERWIIDETTGITPEDVSRAQTASHPFLIGVGNCAGQKLALQEMLIVISRTLFTMDARAVPEDLLGAGSPELGWGRRNKDHFQLDDFYLGLRNGPMIQFKKRIV